MSKSIYEDALEIIDSNTDKSTHRFTVLGVNEKTPIEQALEQAQKQEQELNQLKQDILTMISSLSKRNIILNPFDNIEAEAFKRIDDVCVKILQKL